MKERSKLKGKMITSIISIITIICCLTLVVFSTYSWFTIQNNAFVQGISLTVKDAKTMDYGGSVYAKRFNLDSTIIYNEYTLVNSKLKLKSSVKYEKDSDVPIENSENEKSNFLFSDMLPGEYVDISVSYHFASVKEDGLRYYISLNNFIKSDTFKLPVDGVEYSHYVLGVFKYRPISLIVNYIDETESLNYSFPIEDYDYKWLSSYNLKENDVLPNQIDLFRGHEYNLYMPNHSSHDFTFRIYEDFSQYFKLVNESGSYVSNLLSKLTFSIGNLLLSYED